MPLPELISARIDFSKLCIKNKFSRNVRRKKGLNIYVHCYILLEHAHAANDIGTILFTALRVSHSLAISTLHPIPKSNVVMIIQKFNFGNERLKLLKL